MAKTKKTNKPKKAKQTIKRKPKTTGATKKPTKAKKPAAGFFVYCLTEAKVIASGLTLAEAVAAADAHTRGHNAHYVAGRPPAPSTRDNLGLGAEEDDERYDVFCPEHNRRLDSDLDLLQAVNVSRTHNLPIRHHAHPVRIV